MATEKIVIYHNPRCTKSRQTLQLLTEQAPDAKLEVIEYLNTPPDKEELKHIIKLLGIDSPRELMRKKENIYESEDLGNSEITTEALINAMVNNPILIERPIVIANGKAAIGRPPENVLAIL
ncbi:Uncharacterized protein YfgD, not an arsenate reductase [hydrothermal vent metagenome]|uniref:Uncharacterized protein YfgD, not an arsenate reductase n=1 Tax=hydrothermal vent metagenome TaxID=652676 RepID=A0A3B0Z0C1_9ZZZZ